MSTYLETPITEPTPVVRLGKHGPWEPLSTKLGALGYHAQTAGAVAGHHVARTPVYYGRVARHAPRGTWRVVHGSWRWFTDSDGRKALRNTFDREGESFRLARAQHREEIKGRAVVSVIGLAIAGLGGAAGWGHVPDALHGLTLDALAAAAPLGLGLIGRPDGASLNVFDRAKSPKGKFYEGDIVRAVVELNIQRISRAIKNGTEVRARGGFDPKTRAHNFVVTLVGGATADDVIGLQNQLCASLGVHRSQVIVSHGETANQVVIDISSESASKRKQLAASTLKAKEVDIAEPIIIGTDAMGQPATVPLYQSIIVIGASGSGKTVLMQNIAANVVLDRIAELWLWDGKGDGDYAHLAHAARVEVIGDGAEDPTMVTRGVAMLNELSKEASRRGEWLLTNGKSKVTPEMGRSIPGLHPIVCIVDECQFLMANREAKTRIPELVRRIRSKNIRLVLASQAIDGTIIEHNFAGMPRTKIAMQLSTMAENTTLLGAGAVRQGFDATSNEMRIGEAVIATKGEGLRRCQVFDLTEDQLQSIGSRHEPVEKLDLLGPAVPMTEANGTESKDQSYSAPEPKPEDAQLLRDIIEAFNSDPQAHIASLRFRVFPKHQGITAEEIRDVVVRATGVKQRGVSWRDREFCDVDPECDKQGTHNHTKQGFYLDEIEPILKQKGIIQ